jgi:membrane protein CcdC involved in cytochrome C biogenesis
MQRALLQSILSGKTAYQGRIKKVKSIFVFIIVMGLILLMMIRRLKSMQKPISKGGLSILYPLLVYLLFVILAGSQLFIDRSGALVLPHLPMLEILTAVALGSILATPILLTTNYELREDQVYVKKSKTFIYIILALLVLRIALKSILYSLIPVTDQLVLTFIMATVYVTIWRVGSFVKFRRLLRGARIRS